MKCPKCPCTVIGPLSPEDITSCCVICGWEGVLCPKCGNEMRQDDDWDGNLFYRCDNPECIKLAREEWHRKYDIPMRREPICSECGSKMREAELFRDGALCRRWKCDMCGQEEKMKV